MHQYQAQVSWSRGAARFTDNRYSRGHTWSFDGGLTVPASASPSVVPAPYSVAEAVDPEEALVAAASSCHMLWFLSLAARKGLVVDSYQDRAVGEMTGDGQGRQAFSVIRLHPVIRFSGAGPGAAELAALHHSAHEACYIANSLRCEVVVET